MLSLVVRNVHQALPEFCHHLAARGVRRPSRNGEVLVYPEPVSTCYERPDERVLLWPQRDANPFFHLFEALWMIRGGQDVGFVSQFNSKIGQYSDDGVVFNGAYGHRWRHHFGRDQLAEVTAALQANPDCRRQVLAMWDARRDLGLSSRDLPCNTHAYLQVGQDGRLDLMVCNRSNDAVWGAYGANAVHFSAMQEFVAAGLERPVGRYWQVSMNTHAYVEPHGALVAEMASLAAQPPEIRSDPYSHGEVRTVPLVSLPAGRWLRELDTLLKNQDAHLDDPFLEHVARPMLASWGCFKSRATDRFAQAIGQTAAILATDWQAACREWLVRRFQAAEAKVAP